MRTPAVLLALVAAAATLIVPAAGHAQAAPIGRCTTTTGTIVAVDFGHWGGPFVRGCGVAPATGYALLHDAGFSTAGDGHDGPGFVCRLGNAAFHGGTPYPTPSQDACAVTPPATAYWSYWIAPAGHRSWTYSPLGVMSDKPEPGEVELWQFGGTDIAGTQGRPSVSPAALRAPQAPAPTRSGAGGSRPVRHSPAPTRHAGSTRQTSARHRPSTASSATGGTGRPPASPAGATPAGPARGRPASTRSAAGRSALGPPAHAAPSPAAPTGPPAGGAASTTSGAPDVIDAKPAAASSASAGSTRPLLIGLALLVVLGGAALLTVVRRRER